MDRCHSPLRRRECRISQLVAPERIKLEGRHPFLLYTLLFVSFIRKDNILFVKCDYEAIFLALLWIDAIALSAEGSVAFPNLWHLNALS
jgi:hypothetical protein